MKIKKKIWGGVRGGSGWGVRVDVIEVLKFLGKFTKKMVGGGVAGLGVASGGGGGRVGVGGQGGCERRIEVFVKIQKKKIFFFGGEGLGRGGGRVGGVRVDVNEELKFLGKFTKKKIGGGGVGRGGGQVGGLGWWGRGVRVDVNAMLGVGLMWVMGDVNHE